MATTKQQEMQCQSSSQKMPFLAMLDSQKKQHQELSLHLNPDQS